MPVIQADKIEELIQLFKNRGVNFYHACQYKDFKTYLQLTGVPSRNLMKSSNLPYTEFTTDDSDIRNGVWDKVFGNLSDFGISFAKWKWQENKAPTPNPYGPILLVFPPTALREAVDIAISLRSAGAGDFNRDRESLGSVNEVDRIFTYSLDNAPNDYAKANIKFKKYLIREFNNSKVASPEVSCTLRQEIIPFDYLDRIVVDSYQINNQELIEKVKWLKQETRINCSVYSRQYAEGRKEIKQNLANLLTENLVTLEEIIDHEQASPNLKDWANRLKKGGNETIKAYKRFAQYLRSGTLLELCKENDE